jgi:outer membrane protein assembly factor BamC
LKIIKFSIVLLTIALISGCGYIYGDNGLIKSQEFDYLRAEETKELDMPEPLVHKNKTNYTVVPQIGEKAKNAPRGKQLGQKAPIQLLAVLDNTRVDKKSELPAVFIMDNRDFIWQTAIKFFEKHQIKLDKADKQQQVIVTDWIPIEEGGIWLGLNGTDEPDLERAKYRVSISDSDLRGEFRLVVERTHSEQRVDDDAAWQQSAVSWQESADMMNLLLSHYDTRIREQEAARQLEIMAGFKVELGQNKASEPALLTEADEKLVWEKIPRVMREIGLVILEKDEKQKTYFMEYKSKEKGFFASLFDSKEKVKLFQEGAYQITLGSLGNRRTLTFRDGQGEALEASKLVAIFPELSRLFGDRR